MQLILDMQLIGGGVTERLVKVKQVFEDGTAIH